MGRYSRDPVKQYGIERKSGDKSKKKGLPGTFSKDCKEKRND